LDGYFVVDSFQVIVEQLIWGAFKEVSHSQVLTTYSLVRRFGPGLVLGLEVFGRKLFFGARIGPWVGLRRGLHQLF